MKKAYLVFFALIMLFSLTSCAESIEGTIDSVLGKKLNIMKTGAQDGQHYILEKIDDVYVLSYVSDGALKDLDIELVKGFVESKHFGSYNIIQYLEDTYPNQDSSDPEFAYALELFQKRQIGTHTKDKLIFYMRPYFYYRLDSDGNIQSAMPDAEVKYLED